MILRALLVLSVLSSAAHAQDEPELEQDLPAIPEDPFGDGWTFVVSPYVWFLALNGDGRVDYVENDIDESFSDIWEDLNWVIEGRFEAYRGKWGYTFDLTYAQIESDSTTPTMMGDLEVESEANIGLIIGSVQRELYRGPLREDDEIKVEGSIGLVRTIVDLEINSNVPAVDVESDERWLDLVFGARSTWAITPRRLVRLSGYVGGFELLGDSSDLTWGIEGLYGWHFGERNAWTLWAGYRWVYLDYDPGNSFALDVDIQGPTAGLAFRW